MAKRLNTGLVAIFFASWSYAFQNIFFRYIGTDFGIFYPFVVRGLLIAAVMCLYIYFTHSFKKIQPKDWKWFIFMPISGVVAFISAFIAINNITIGATLFLHYAALAITGFVLGYVLFRERFDLVKLFSLTLSIVGLALVFTVSQLQNSILYLFLALISGVASSLWYLFSKKISKTYSPTQILAVDSIFILIFTLALSILTREKFHAFAFNMEWFGVLGATLTSFAAFALTIYGFKYLQAHIASLVLLLEVVFAVILAWILFSEIPSLQAFIGGGLILTGVILSNLKSN